MNFWMKTDREMCTSLSIEMLVSMWFFFPVYQTMSICEKFNRNYNFKLILLSCLFSLDSNFHFQLASKTLISLFSEAAERRWCRLGPK